MKKNASIYVLETTIFKWRSAWMKTTQRLAAYGHNAASFLAR
jgi:hypothetical protein